MVRRTRKGRQAAQTDGEAGPAEAQSDGKGRARVIGRTTARAMLSWAHFQFRQRLEAKAREYPWVRVHADIGEEWTSKTCTRCGHIRHDLGAAEVYRCAQCGLVIDRDVNGARNIFIKHSGLLGLEQGASVSFGTSPTPFARKARKVARGAS
jgi:transposase